VTEGESLWELVCEAIGKLEKLDFDGAAGENEFLPDHPSLCENSGSEPPASPAGGF
jgi:hypothetical protein